MAPKPTTSFGVRLKQTRELAKLTQSDLAEKAELTPAAISQLESGDRLPAFATLRRLANALKTSVSYLMGEEAPELPAELRAFFRDLEALDAADVSQVREYAQFLKQKAEEKSK